MIDRPDPVSRVAPPIATMIQTMPATDRSQRATALGFPPSRSVAWVSGAAASNGMLRR